MLCSRVTASTLHVTEPVLWRTSVKQTCSIEWDVTFRIITALNINHKQQINKLFLGKICIVILLELAQTHTLISPTEHTHHTHSSHTRAHASFSPSDPSDLICVRRWSERSAPSWSRWFHRRWAARERLRRLWGRECARNASESRTKIVNIILKRIWIRDKNQIEINRLHVSRLDWCVG